MLLTVALTAVLVVSILAATAGFIGIAAAADVDYTDPSVSQGPIFTGSTVDGTMTVENTANSASTYNVSLSVDGSVEQWANGTLTSGETRRVEIPETLWDVGDRSVTVSGGSTGASEKVTVERAMPTYHGGPDRLGHYPDVTGPTSQPEEVWNISDGSLQIMQSTVVNGTVYTAFHNGGSLYALDSETGAEEWNATPGGASGSTWSTPAYADGVLYLGSNDYKLHAVDASDGSELWNYSVFTNVRSAPAVVDGVVYFGRNGGNFTAVNATTGEKIWNYNLPTVTQVKSNPAVVDGVVYFGDHSGNVTALDTTTGNLIWKFSTDGDPVGSDPTVVNDTVYIGSGYDTATASGNHEVYALNATDGTERWNYTMTNQVNGGVAYADGTVYAASRGGNVTALDASAGSVTWEHTLGDVQGAPVVANGVVYVMDFGNDSVHALDAADGTELWAYGSPTTYLYSTPLVWDNYLYYGANQQLFALKSPAPSISSVNATNPSSQNLSISFDSSEQLNNISVSVSGPSSATFTEGDFTESGSGPYTYTLSSAYDTGADGDYTVSVDTAENSEGQDGASGESDSVTVDTAAPTFDAASKVDTTTIDVDISDGGTGLDKASIDKSDFALSAGTIASIDTSGVTDGATGTQTVTLTLDSAVDSDTVDVSIVGSIDDKDGNSLSSGTKTVSGMDGVAPVYDSATQVDDTTIDVTITDGVDVDESTISTADFSLDPATLDSLSVNESGSDAVVTLHLTEPVDWETVDVSIAGGIDDTSGNSLSSGTESVSNMDGVAPTMDDASRVDDTTLDVTLSEDGTGIDRASIEQSDFSVSAGTIASIDTSAVTDGATGLHTITVTLDSPVDSDTVTATLQSDGVDDKNGNTRTSGSVTASGMDGIAPVLDSASNVDDTTIEVTITDGEDVDESSISAADFSLDTGTVASISTTESGSDAVVTLTLDSAVDASSVNVSIVGSIDDTSGNSLSSGTKAVSNMDGVAPTLDGASKVDKTTLNITLSDGGTGIDKASIETSDFSLSTGSIASVDTSGVTDGATGPQTVTLTLDSAVDSETVGVSIDGTIADSSGNSLSSGTKTISGMDGVVPTFEGASKKNDTAIEVTITDGVDVEESSISNSDFSLDAGTVTAISTAESGSDAVVTLTLDAPVDVATIDVSLVGSVADSSGNSLSSGTQTVADMDGVTPAFESASKVDDTTIEVIISDGNDVDESTISKSDFSLDAGLIGAISVSESGPDAVVVLSLDSAADSETVTVSIDGSIVDASGNSLSSGTKTVSEMDGVAPAFESATKTGDTTIEVTITDGVDVNESSVSKSDFSLDNGTLSTLSTTGNGSDAVVTLTLDAPVDVDAIEVSIAGSIDDASGNTLSSGAKTVSDMDGVAPTITDSSLAADNSYVDVTLSEGVYRSDGTGPVTAANLSLEFAQNDGAVTDISIGSLTDTGGNALAGGETTVRVHLSPTDGPASGTETVQLQPANGSSLADGSANGIATSENTTTIPLTDRRAPNVASFSVSNPTSRTVQVSFASDEQLSSISVSVSDAESATLTYADFSETGNDDGTYTYEATYNGSSAGDYTATLDAVEDAAGNDGASGESETVTVDPPSLPDYEASPRDLDGDGLFEDGDGDGEFDIFDVQALFNHVDSESVQNNPRAFNFGGDGNPVEVTIVDVQGLFNRLVDQD